MFILMSNELTELYIFHDLGFLNVNKYVLFKASQIDCCA